MVEPALDGLDLRSATLLYWLRQVDLNQLRDPEVTRQRRWRSGNVAEVLAWV
jgi:hypothetical protein